MKFENEYQAFPAPCHDDLGRVEEDIDNDYAGISLNQKNLSFRSFKQNSGNHSVPNLSNVLTVAQEQRSSEIKKKLLAVNSMLQLSNQQNSLKSINSSIEQTGSVFVNPRLLGSESDPHRMLLKSERNQSAYGTT